MTKPSSRLYVSYVRLDSEGKAQRPSYLIGVLERMFPDLSVKEASPWEEKLDCSTIETAMDYLAYGREGDDWYSLARFFWENGDDRRIVELILDAEYEKYCPERISRVVSEVLYGRELVGSVTRLERFAACAYAHFLRYGLALRERKQAGFASVDMGNLYHEALERYSRKLEESDWDWFTIDDEKRRRLCEESMEETLAGFPSLSWDAAGADGYMAERMKGIFERTVWALTEQVRKGVFVPEKFEVSFQEADVRDALCYELGENQRLTLTGRMDRLDICEDEEGSFVKVIDYKSGSTRFDLSKIYQGTQLQLVVYLNAAMAIAQKRRTGDRVVPGGVLYCYMQDPVIDAKEGMTQEEAWDAVLVQLRPDGLVNREEEVFRRMDREFAEKSQVIPVTLKKSGELSERLSHVASEEEFGVLREYVDHEIERAGRQILDGVIDVNPIEDGTGGSCAYCPYRAVCSLDPKIEGYEYRRPQKLGREDVFDRMRTELALAHGDSAGT